MFEIVYEGYKSGSLRLTHDWNQEFHDAKFIVALGTGGCHCDKVGIMKTPGLKSGMPYEMRILFSLARFVVFIWEMLFQK